MPQRIPLSQLNACFIRVRMEPAPKYLGRKQEDGTTQWGGFLSPVVYPVPHMEIAHGVKFSCPQATDPEDNHPHYIYFKLPEPIPGDMNVNHEGNAVSWEASGTDLDTLSLTPSIQTHGAACRWHGWIRNGELQLD